VCLCVCDLVGSQICGEQEGTRARGGVGVSSLPMISRPSVQCFAFKCFVSSVSCPVFRSVSQCFVSSVSRSVFRVQCFAFSVSRSVFRVQCFASSVSRSVFRVQCFAFSVSRSVFRADMGFPAVMAFLR
jgi:hypothetical protein